jgi:hypothetical protein
MAHSATVALVSALLVTWLVAPAGADSLRSFHKLERRERLETNRAERIARQGEVRENRNRAVSERIRKVRKARALAKFKGDLNDAEIDDLDLEFLYGDLDIEEP